MPATVFGAQAAVSMLNRAFHDISPTFAIYANQVNSAGSTPQSIQEFAIKFGETFVPMDDLSLAFRVLANMGLLPNTELLLGLIDYFGANPGARGLVVLQIGQILADQELATGAMAKYGAAAAAWNTEVMNSTVFSTNPANTTGSYLEWFPDLMYVRYSAERTLIGATENNEWATTSVSTLIAVAAMRAQAKTKADATDAAALESTGNTTAATAAAADDAALLKVTLVFSYALYGAIYSTDHAKGAANTALTWADAFVDFAATTLTTQEDDAAASAIKAQATTQLATANALAANVDAIAANTVPDQTVTLVGLAAYPLSGLQ